MMLRPISRPTVLILGAGASIPYKFPSGEDLFNGVRRATIDQLVQDIRPASAALAAPLQEAVRTSLDRSLDALLELRPDLEEAGKTYMARALLKAEAADKRAVVDSSGAWYRNLWDAFDLSSLEAFSKSPLTVITFNYDRSLEYRLATALAQRFQIPMDQCALAMKRVGAIHLHGQLGFLPGFDAEQNCSMAYGGSISAGSGVTDDDCQVAARNVRIVHQPKPTDEAFVRARAAIAQADRVAFLGFGYARQNIERLELGACMQPNTRVYQCIHGFTSAQEAALIRPHFQRWNSRFVGFEVEDIVGYLRHFPDLLT